MLRSTKLSEDRYLCLFLSQWHFPLGAKNASLVVQPGPVRQGCNCKKLALQYLSSQKIVHVGSWPKLWKCFPSPKWTNAFLGDAAAKQCPSIVIKWCVVMGVCKPRYIFINVISLQSGYSQDFSKILWNKMTTKWKRTTHCRGFV